MSMLYADIIKGVKRIILDEYFFLYFFCGSGVVSVMFHFMFIHHTFSSIWVAVLVSDFR